MHFAGFVALEGNLFAMIVTKNGDAPTNADSTPTYKIYGPGGTLMDTGIVVSHTSDLTGLYRITKAVTAALGYVAGSTYFVVVSYAIGTAKSIVLSFVVS